MRGYRPGLRCAPSATLLRLDCYVARAPRNDGGETAAHYSMIGTYLAAVRGTVPSRRGSSAISTWRRNGRNPDRW